jgi:hypothetical protein
MLQVLIATGSIVIPAKAESLNISGLWIPAFRFAAAGMMIFRVIGVFP